MDKQKPPPDRVTSRKQRLGQALKANLQKRKSQARARSVNKDLNEPDGVDNKSDKP